MKMLLRYPGGKAWIAPAIVAAARAIGADTVLEPFLGGGGSAIEAMRAGLRVRGSDSNPYLCALWNLVRDRPDDLVRAVRAVRPSVEDYRQRWGVLRSRMGMDELEGGVSKLVVHQMSYGGLGERAGSPIGGWGQTGKKYLIDCRWNPDRIERKIRKLHPLLHARLVGRVLCASFEHAMTETRREFMYLDPPYYGQGTALYADGVDHVALRDMLFTDARLFLLSYDDCEEVRTMYATLRLLPVRYQSKMAGKNEGIELMIMNDARVEDAVRKTLVGRLRLA